jgi:hypothetical protein
MGEKRHKRADGLKTAHQAYQMYQALETLRGLGDRGSGLLHDIKEAILFVWIAALAVGLLWTISLVVPHFFYALRVVK